MSDSNKIDNLDPSRHKQSVRQFVAFFHLHQHLPDMAFLVRVLTHFAKLPYENISKIVKLQENYTTSTRLRLPEEVMADYVEHRLGGTCFSLTFFLQTILTDCGYLCYPIIAHMPRMRNSHCALIVIIDHAKFLVDPGYLLNQPLQIAQDQSRIYRTEHTGVEMLFNHDDEHYYVYTFHGRDKKMRYRFRDVPLSMPQFLKYWLDSFYWPGMKGICLTQVKENGMIYVHNDYVQLQNEQGKKKGIVTDIHRLVKEAFNIEPEWIERARGAIPDIITLGQKHGYYRKRESL